MKTYAKKLEEMRLKSLKIIEDGLNDESPTTAFSNAVLLMAFTASDVLEKELPDVLDAEEIEEKEAK